MCSIRFPKIEFLGKCVIRRPPIFFLSCYSIRPIYKKWRRHIIESGSAFDKKFIPRKWSVDLHLLRIIKWKFDLLMRERNIKPNTWRTLDISPLNDSPFGWVGIGIVMVPVNYHNRNKGKISTLNWNTGYSLKMSCVQCSSWIPQRNIPRLISSLWKHFFKIMKAVKASLCYAMLYDIVINAISNHSIQYPINVENEIFVRKIHCHSGSEIVWIQVWDWFVFDGYGTLRASELYALLL